MNLWQIVHCTLRVIIIYLAGEKENVENLKNEHREQLYVGSRQGAVNPSINCALRQMMPCPQLCQSSTQQVLFLLEYSCI